MSDEWAVVMTVETEQEGELIEGFLRSRNIPCEAESLVATPYPTSFGALGVIKIRVPEERAEEARRLIEERESIEFSSGSETGADADSETDSDLDSDLDSDQSEADGET